MEHFVHWSKEHAVGYDVKGTTVASTFVQRVRRVTGCAREVFVALGTVFVILLTG